MMILQITFSWMELLHDILGSYDLANIIFGWLIIGLGIALSMLVPDAVTSKLTGALNSIVIINRKQQLAVAIIVSYIFMRLYGDIILKSNMTLFITFCLGIGLLNYHLLALLVNLCISAVNKITNQNSNNQPPNPPTT